MFLNALIPTSGVNILTVPASLEYAVVLVTCCNYDTLSAANLDIHVVPNGLSATNRTKIIAARPIAVGDSLLMSTERLLLSAGDVVRFVASIDNVLTGGVSFTQL